MKLSKRIWLIISGIQWLGIGVMLLMKGLKLVVSAAEQHDVAAPLLKYFVSFAGTRHQGSLLIVCLALLIGFIKGRTILAKTVQRIAQRIQAGPALLALKEVYDRKYYIVLASMIGLGVLLRIFRLPIDIHGGIDVAIGSALINGAMLYFRHLLVPQKAA